MNTKEQLVRYFFVGILNTLFSYLCYVIFLYMGLSYPIALLIATIIGVLFNFKTTGKLVFKNSNNLLIFRFIGVYTIVYFFNIYCIRFINQMSIDLYISGFLTLIISAGLGFILNKLFVFQPSANS